MSDVTNGDSAENNPVNTEAEPVEKLTEKANEEGHGDPSTEDAPEEAQSQDSAQDDSEDTPSEKATVKAEADRIEVDRRRFERQMKALREVNDANRRMRAELDELKVAQQQQASPSDKPPSENDFDTLEDYRDAYAKWYADQEINKYKTETQTKQQEAQQRQAQIEQKVRFETSVEQFAAKVPDWENAVEQYTTALDTFDADHPSVLALNEGILNADNPAAVLYHLGRNANEIERLAALTPIKAFKELVLLEDRLTKKSAQVPSTPPKQDITAKPIEPLRSGGQPKPDPMRMDKESFLKFIGQK